MNQTSDNLARKVIRAVLIEAIGEPDDRQPDEFRPVVEWHRKPPTNGVRECSRRARQIAGGRLRAQNGFVGSAP